MRRLLECLVLSALSVALLETSSAAVPASITVQGKLTDAGGVPLPAGPKSFNFNISGSEVGGAPVWPSLFGEPQVLSSDASGLWIALMGAISPLTESVFSDTVRWLEVTVDGMTLPRVRLATGPYAHRVATVDGASGGTITSKVSIGTGHTNTGADAFVAGATNTVSGQMSAVPGGSNNIASGDFSAVSGGSFNEASGRYAIVGGGLANYATDSFAFVGGGSANVALAKHTVIGGGHQNRTEGVFSTIGGGRGNELVGKFSTISGGDSNVIAGNTEYASILGGRRNSAYSYGAVGGGEGNLASSHGVVAGGENNWAIGHGVVGGGKNNEVSVSDGTIAGGTDNRTSASAATVAGGSRNHAGGLYSMVAGGKYNKVLGSYSMAAGRFAHAVHEQSFVWNSEEDTVESTRHNQFLISASGGVRVSEPAGGSYSNDIGDVFQDNLIVAWGSIDADGSILADFGVSSVSHTSTGAYRINLNATAASSSNLAVSAILEVDNIPTSDATARLIYANMIGGDGNSFDIFVTNGSHVATDNQFTFIVTAR
jgi:hypothetical protein